MQQNKSFLLRAIAGIPYIMPYGQMIADHRRGLKTNATGVWLWKLLEEEHSLEDIISISADYYEITDDELPAFREEITQFVNQLIAYGILTDSAYESVPATASHTNKLLSIAGLNIKYTGPEEIFPAELNDFVTIPAVTKLHQTIFFHAGGPAAHTNGNVILRDPELVIMEQADTYILLFPNAPDIIEIHLRKDASEAHCYYLRSYSDTFKTDLFHAIRLLFLYLAQKHGMAAIHSASILYNGKLWLFSGHSGMGKSTHTDLWKELYHTPVINGDLNLITIKDGAAVVHGIPWCGTSGIYDTKTYPLGGIILLNQAPADSVEELNPDEKQLLVLQRLISPNWTKELWELNLNLIEEIAKKIMICKLHCTKEYSAVETIKHKIDSAD